MKTALYCRVSTDMQKEKGYSIESQTDKLLAYCVSRDITDYEIYVDGGYTGSDLARPAMKRLIEDIKLKLVSAVVVVKLDRLSRKTKDTLFLVEDIFVKNNVTFVSLSESIDTSTASGKFFITILSSVAQLERENIKERCMSGMKKKVSMGLKSQTAKTLVGYDFDKLNKTYSINEYEAMQIREVFTRYIAGESLRGIYRYLRDNFTTKYGNWKVIDSVRRILDNETYTGKFVHQKQFVEGVNIPQIIDLETFNKAKEIRDYKSEHYFRHTSNHLLTGLVWCGECGGRLRGYIKRADNLQYYVCYNRMSQTEVTKRLNHKCKLKFINCKYIDTAVLESVKHIVQDKTFYEEIKKPDIANSSDLEILERELKKITDKSNKLVDLLLEEQIDKETFTKRLDEMNVQKAALNNQLLETRNKKAAPIAKAEYAEIKETALSVETASLQDKRRLLSLLIDKITVYADQSITIKWLF